MEPCQMPAIGPCNQHLVNMLTRFVMSLVFGLGLGSSMHLQI